MAALQPIIVGKGRVDESNTWSHIEMAKLLIFNGEASKIVEFIIVYRLYIYILNQQFITRRARADRGSYFRNYVHKTHT